MGESFLQEVLDESDVVATVSIALHAAEWLNRSEMFPEARGFIDRVIDLVGEHGRQFTPGWLTYIWDEFGNTLRYMHSYDEALKAYGIRRQVCGTGGTGRGRRDHPEESRDRVP